MFIQEHDKHQKFLKVASIIVLGVMLVIFSFFTIREVYRINYLFTKDPSYHMTIAESFDQKEPFSTSIKTYDDGTLTTKYATLLRVFAVEVHEVTNISYLNIFRLLGIFTRLFAALIIYLIAKKISKNDFISLVPVALFLSSRYVIFRAIITFPENLVLPFHLLIFYEIYKSFKSRSVSYALPIYLAGAALIHYRSMVIPAILLLCFGAYIFYLWLKSLKNKKIKLYSLKNLILVLLLFLILSSPVLVQTVRIFSVYWNGNVGSSATYADSTEGDARYTPPNFDFYTGNLGYLFVLAILLGVVILTLKRKKEPHDWLVGVWFLFAFLLSQGTRLHIYVPTDRMIIYLILPSLIISLYALKFILKIERGRLLLAMYLVVLFSTLSTVAPSVNGWKAFKDYEINQVSWLNTNLNSQDNTVLLTSGVSYLNLGYTQYSVLETRREYYNKVIYNDYLNLGEIKNLYKDKHVYLAVNYDNSTLIPPVNTDTIQKVYESEKSIIYDLGIQ